METIIYGLTSVVDAYKVRYIGQTRNLDKRIKGHFNRVEKGIKTKLDAWIVSRSRSCSIIVIVIKTNAVWNDDEIFYIRNFKENGFDLLNITDGGEGGIMPLESRMRGADKIRGSTLSEETRALLSVKMKATIKERGGHWTKGIPQTPEHRAKGAAARRGKKYGPNPKLSRPMSEETKRKISVALTGRKLSIETRNKLKNKRPRLVPAEESFRRSQSARRSWINRRLKEGTAK